ncbi:MAG: hypothetical protein ACK56F_19475, partial [bacterium]
HEEVVRHRLQRRQGARILGPTRVLAQAAEVAVVSGQGVLVCTGLGQSRAEIAIFVLELVAARGDFPQTRRLLAMQCAGEQRQRVDAAADRVARKRLEVDLRDVAPSEVVTVEMIERELRTRLEKTVRSDVLELDGVEGRLYVG